MSASVSTVGSTGPPALPTRLGFGLRLWKAIASPRWTLLLLLLLALAIALSMLLPQAEAIPAAIQHQWLATLQGRYGRWTGLLSSLGFFDIAHALWLQVLLILAAYQGLIATAEGCVQARRWMHGGTEPTPQPPPSLARERRIMDLPLALEQSVAQTQLAFQRLGYRVLVSQDVERALLEGMRHPWLTLGRPLAQGGVVLVCLAGLLGARLDWQEGPVTLSAGQTHGLHHVPGMALHLEKTALARGSSWPVSWVSLVRGEAAWCRGIIFPDGALKCGGLRIQQVAAEPALRVTGHDRLGHPLAIQPMRGGEPAAPEVILRLPDYAPDSYAALPEQGLAVHVELSADHARPLFRLQVYRGQQGAPLLQRDIADPTSLAWEDLTLSLSPTRVPSFRVSHRPSRLLAGAGLSLTLVGLLVRLALSASHLWVQVEQREDGVCVRLWQGLPLPFHVPTIPEIGSQTDSSSTSRMAP